MSVYHFVPTMTPMKENLGTIRTVVFNITPDNNDIKSQTHKELKLPTTFHKLTILEQETNPELKHHHRDTPPPKDTSRNQTHQQKTKIQPVDQTKFSANSSDIYQIHTQ